MVGESICVELTRLRAEGAELDRILTRAVELLHGSDARLRWTGLYERYPDGVLRLGPFVGPTSDHAYVVPPREGAPPPAERPRPLAPARTPRGSYELVVPLRAEGQVFGQLDLDSDDPTTFTQDMCGDVQRVADCLAELWQRRI